MYRRDYFSFLSSKRARVI